MFADNTYSKPFFVTYLNTAFFTLPLIPFTLRELSQRWKDRELRGCESHHANEVNSEADESRPFLGSSSDVTDNGLSSGPPCSEPAAGVMSCHIKENGGEKLDFRTTARLAFEFCLLWVRDTDGKIYESSLRIS